MAAARPKPSRPVQVDVLIQHIRGRKDSARSRVIILLNGCSSHSGRRTFITRLGRVIPLAGGSLRDVQLLARHRSLVTTERYIDGDSHAQRKLVALL